MFCALSGNVPVHPVISKISGHIFERQLIEKFLDNPDSEGKCPISGEPLTKSDLLSIPYTPPSTSLPTTSIPGLLNTLHNEWDEVMLETFHLKQQLETTRQELSQALYQYDAACRVIARLLHEKEATPPSQETQQEKPKIPQEIQQAITEKGAALMAARKAAKQQGQEATPVTQVQEIQCSSSHTPHRSDKPGILCVAQHATQDALFVTGGVDTNCKVFHRDSGKVICTLSGHGKKVCTVQYHPSEQTDLIVSGSMDKTMKVWYPETKGKYKLGLTLQGHEGGITSTSIHPIGDYLTSSSEDGTWGFFNLRTGDCLFRQSATTERMFTADIHPDGKIVGTATSSSVIRLWDLNSTNIAATFEGHEGIVNDISFAPNGYHMLSAGQDGYVRLWDLRKLKDVMNLNLETSVQKVQYESEQGKFFVVAAGQQMQVYHHLKKTSSDLVQTYTEHSALVTDIHISKNVTLLASTSMDRSLKFYE